MICLLTWCLVVNTSVLAAPSGGVFTVGTGSIAEGANTAVTVNQAQSIIQWGTAGSGGIDTVAGESLTFLQAEGLSNSAVLNRIMSGNPTQFNGTLNGLDMRIFVVNPAGVIFGNGSQINVSQLVASGLNMSNEDFLNATGASPTDLRFEGGNGVVENWGTIQANSVYLVGKQVSNIAGSIQAPNGLVVLAAGDRVYLAQDGSNVLVEVDGPSEYLYDVDNRTHISARNGQIILAAGDTFSRAVKNSSWLIAQGGSIEMRAASVTNRGVITTSSDTDGGTVKLTGIEEVIVTTDDRPTEKKITADATSNGDGGTVTIESEGTVTLAADTLITARGGSFAGNGGTVKITAQDFVIAGQIDASPANTDYEPGTLTIDPSTVTIANGANAGALDTLYENDIETWGTKGTSLVVYADDGINVQNIADGEIKGGYGNIELYATGAASSVSFEDATDTISTTLGDIRMTAGAGGLTLGSLQTGGPNLEATPGEIHLSTHDGGDITAENLTIHGGQGHAEINVDAADDLTINGDVIVGSDSPIHNVPNGADGEAAIILKAGDDVVLNGNVTASSHGLNEDAEGSVTKSSIGIFSGTGVPVSGSTTVNGDLVATAKASSNGTSEATIEINSWGAITWGPQAADPLAEGDAEGVKVQSKESAEDTNEDGDVAKIIITEQGNHPTVQGTHDFFDVTAGRTLTGNVVTNDIDLDPQGNALSATLIDGPVHAASFVLNEDGSFSYTPQAGFVGTDTFTYTASNGLTTSAEVLVTITVNALVAPLSSPTAPGLERVAFEVSGCPAVVKWAATELGVGAGTVQIRIANALALTRDIQPCDTCADLKDAAMILQDADGTHVAALAQVINEFTVTGAPPTEEQMSSIADAIARGAKADNRYTVAGEYLDAVAEYIGILVGKLGFSTEESVLLVTDKYINRLAETGNASVAAMVARLAVLAAR